MIHTAVGAHSAGIKSDVHLCVFGDSQTQFFTIFYNVSWLNDAVER
jgi:hypothetical protein